MEKITRNDAFLKTVLKRNNAASELYFKIKEETEIGITNGIKNLENIYRKTYGEINSQIIEDIMDKINVYTEELNKRGFKVTIDINKDPVSTMKNAQLDCWEIHIDSYYEMISITVSWE